ncbi:hypothetical protein KO465_03875 [Candidatus Micrarchaeota archaeon]|nr:hypothetical protein [Candidatus Micrarchaeota archaeon]
MDWLKIRIYLFIVLVAVGLASMGYRYYTEGTPVYLGIDFSGGTRIPVLLERPVDADTMSDIVDNIKKRASSFALTEVKVRALGSDEIAIELPTSSEEYVSRVEEILSSKGVFMAIVDGKIAVTGEDLYESSINDATESARMSKPGAGPGLWGVGFTVTQKGAEKMAATMNNKANYPVYMFLDRPSNSVILVPRSALLENVPALQTEFEKRGTIGDTGEQMLLNVLITTMKLEKDDVPVYILEDTNSYALITPTNNQTKVLVPDNVSPDVVSNLESRGFSVVRRPYSDFVPSYMPNEIHGVVADEWAVAGLMNAPGVSPDLSIGVATGNSYYVSGVVDAQTNTLAVQKAQEQKQRIMSILKGGALPVQITLGSRTIVPAPLGGKFLEYSVLGILLAIISISLFIGLRYRSPKVIIGLLLASLGEVIILVSFIGSFSIDLGAMAGIIAAIGISVDSEVVITDEMLSKSGNIKDRIKRAFEIVMTTGAISVITMIPLIFSGLTEIIGFATSTMLGTLIGMFISRYAYAEYIKRFVLQED